MEQPADQNHRLVFRAHGDHPFGGGLVHFLFLPKSNRRPGHQAGFGDSQYKSDVQAADGINNLINPSLQAIILNIDTKPELSLEVRAQNILDHAPNLDVFDGGIYFVDQHGIVFKSQPEQPELIGQDWSDTSQFRYVRDNPPGSRSYYEYPNHRDRRGRGLFVSSGQCTTQLSEFIGAGYYCLAINPNEQNILYTTVNSLSLGQNVYILDGNQRIIFSPDSAQLGRDLSEEASIQQLLQSESKSIRFQNGTRTR